MISININDSLKSLTNIIYAISRLGILDVDGYFLQAVKEKYEQRVFDENIGSRKQTIGILPTPMYETGELISTFFLSHLGIVMPEHGFLIEGLKRGQDIWGVSLANLEEQLYEASLERFPVFGPIWDITDNEAEEFEKQSVRMFYKLYDS